MPAHAQRRVTAGPMAGLFAATALSTVLLFAVAWSTIGSASRAGATAHASASSSALYTAASSSLANVQSAETRFVFMPTDDGIRQLDARLAEATARIDALTRDAR